MSLFKEKFELKVEETEFKAQRALSRFSPWQRWLMILCLVGAIPGYYIARAAGNAYFASSYSQDLITAHPSFEKADKLVVDRVDVASLGENEYAAVAQIVNPNLDLASKSVKYEFNFYDQAGQTAAPAASGSFYILPNSRKYLIIPKITSLTNLAGVQINLSEDIVWQKKLDLPKVNLVASQPKGQDIANPFGYVLEGSVYNDSAYHIKEIKLSFLLFGDGGKVIGGSQRSEFDVKPYEKRGYRQIWAGISGRNVVRAETVAETNLLDKSNLVAPQTPSGGGAGDLGR